MDMVYKGQPCRDMTESDFDDVRETLQAAKYKIAKKAPYMFHAVMEMKFVLSRTFPALMGVDQYWRCYVRPDGVLALSQAGMIDEVAGVIFHEAMHLLYNHTERADWKHVSVETRTHANVAMDAAINPQVIESGFPLPVGGVFPEVIGLPAGWVWEEYYDHLLQEYPELTMEMLVSMGLMVDQGSGSDGCYNEHEEEGPGESTPGDGKDRNGKSSPYGKFDDPSDFQKTNPVTAEIIKNEVAKSAKEHHAKNPGSIPGGLVVWADGQLKPPKVRWDRELRMIVRSELTRGLMDQSYGVRHPQQQMYKRIVLPGNVGYKVRVGINADTSGSMCDGISFDRMMAEVAGLLKHVEDVLFVSCDADVHQADKITNAKKVKLVGGGGTNMGRGLDYFANEVKPRPDLVITITDGYTSWPDKNYPFRHVTLLTQPDGARPNFGKVIVVEPD